MNLSVLFVGHLHYVSLVIPKIPRHNLSLNTLFVSWENSFTAGDSLWFANTVRSNSPLLICLVNSLFEYLSLIDSFKWNSLSLTDFEADNISGLFVQEIYVTSGVSFSFAWYAYKNCFILHKFLDVKPFILGSLFWMKFANSSTSVFQF